MPKGLFLLLALVGFGFAAPHPAFSESAVSPNLSDENFANATVAGMSQRSHAVSTWNIASNSSNAQEIYSTLVKFGGRPDCHDVQIVLLGGDPVTKQNCNVTARVAHLTVTTNYLIIWPSTTEVDVQGETTCEQEWLATSRGIHRQIATLWYFCQFMGVARPN